MHRWWLVRLGTECTPRFQSRPAWNRSSGTILVVWQCASSCDGITASPAVENERNQRQHDNRKGRDAFRQCRMLADPMHEQHGQTGPAPDQRRREAQTSPDDSEPHLTSHDCSLPNPIPIPDLDAFCGSSSSLPRRNGQRDGRGFPDGIKFRGRIRLDDRRRGSRERLCALDVAPRKPEAHAGRTRRPAAPILSRRRGGTINGVL